MKPKIDLNRNAFGNAGILFIINKSNFQSNHLFVYFNFFDGDCNNV